ncbi:hypothetical protein G9A89_012430 [Geosiphon pyriformis]|nr:hypothetical protein G9A89_012430 [Geosiphon pyriformis]
MEEATNSDSPGPKSYVSRVGFDTFSAQETASREFSFTLQTKVAEYQTHKRSRTFLVATDLEGYSDNGIKWLMETLVGDGDEVVALRVIPLDFMDSISKTSMRSSVEAQKEKTRQDANQLMQKIIELNDEKAINIVVEFMVGKVQDTIQNMIKMYQPELLVVGTRGRSQAKSLLMGSTSLYCIQHSPVPVIVVRADYMKSEKEKKSKKKLNIEESEWRSSSTIEVENSELEDTIASSKSFDGLSHDENENE